MNNVDKWSPNNNEIKNLNVEIPDTKQFATRTRANDFTRLMRTLAKTLTHFSLAVLPLIIKSKTA